MDILNQFDNALNSITRLGEIVQAKDEIYRLDKQNNESLNTCGGCYWWMKTECPKEPKIKPSCSHSKCSSFKLDPFDASMVEKNNLKIEEIKSNLFKQL